MKVRRRALSSGWYPEDADEALAWLDDWADADRNLGERNAVAGIVPHAGWYFSGELAFRVFRRIVPSVETVVIVGGHLSRESRCIAAQEERYETPFGEIRADGELLHAISAEIDLEPDRQADNTVEIHLPILRSLLPSAMALAIRCPPSASAVHLGKAVAAVAERLGRSVAIVGSTDLTHYGPQYGFSPHGVGDAGHRWVREKNDAGMIDRFLALNPEDAIEYALGARSACSVGAAAASIAFAREKGAAHASLLDYRTSLERGPASSFVGYAAIVYS